MKKAVWCPCGCCRRLRQTVIPPRAVALMNRRRLAEIRERQAAQLAAQLRQMFDAQKLANAAPGGHA